MLKPTIIDNITLPNGEVGKCGYLNLTEDKQMTILYNTKEGNDYTLSFFVKADSNKVFELFQGNEPNDVKADVTTEWSKVKFSFKANGKQIGVYIPVGEYYLYQLKLEDGKVATSWTASPNDTTVQTQSMIDQSAEGITSTVERVVLEQVGEDFVEKSKVISEINQSAEAVSINASKINLNGVVTANENFQILEDGTMKCQNAEIIDGNINIHTNADSEDVIELSYAYDEDTGRTVKISPMSVTASKYSLSNPNDVSKNAKVTQSADNIVIQAPYNNPSGSFGGWREIEITPSTIKQWVKPSVSAPYNNFNLDSDGNVSFRNLTMQNLTATSIDTLSSGIKVKSLDRSRNDVAIWSDSEGGNIEIHAGNGHTNSWQMDAFDGNLRGYTFRENTGAISGFTIRQDGTMTIDQIGDVFCSRDTWWSDVMLTDISDANQITRNGVANTIGGWENLPSDGWGHLISFASGSDRLQLWYGMNSHNVLWVRGCRQGSWGSWRKVLDSGNGVQSVESNDDWSNMTQIGKLRNQGYIVGWSGEGTVVWSVSAWSDSKLKKNIKDTKVNGLDVISKIQHKEYDWKYDDLGDSVKLGYVANELKDVIPEAVISVPQDNFHGYDELYQIDMVKMIPYMTKSIQELSAEVDSLKKEIKELKGGKIYGNS